MLLLTFFLIDGLYTQRRHSNIFYFLSFALQYLPIEKDVVCKDKDAEAGVEEDKEVLEAGAGEEESCTHGKLRGGG
jgi:hypothetical protein